MLAVIVPCARALIGSITLGATPLNAPPLEHSTAPRSDIMFCASASRAGRTQVHTKKNGKPRETIVLLHRFQISFLVYEDITAKFYAMLVQTITTTKAST
ncbi:hypothetical protein Tcan_02659 [Toxocara canis]|uniref:Uncharacterized protein n=1 Tax=Toxocara canis TaxID=6265 RepID=A0A0B2V064_TOXCA|nr:hypothetical protein Tcan_02659 [Toxocara canis]